MSRATPIVSVVVPMLDAEVDIVRCLASLRDQNQRDRLEILVVDNGSRDGTVAACRRFGVEPLSEPRRGAGIARNRGIEAARGEVIAFTDADCEVSPEWVTKLLRALDGRTAVMGTIEARPGGRFARARAALHRDYLEECRGLAAAGRLDRLDTANAAVLREGLGAVGGFHDEIFPAEDRELGARLADRFGPIGFADAARVRHRYEEGLLPAMRKSRAVGRMWGRMARLLEPVFLARHFPDVVGVVERARAEKRDRLASLKLTMRLWHELVRCLTSGRREALLRHYLAATRLEIRLGAMETIDGSY
ncbi:MAG: glycosyltransferase [Candidatus Binatia bacterium]